MERVFQISKNLFYDLLRRGSINEVKSFSPLGIKIQQFLFMKKLANINFFFSVVANMIGFARKTNSPITSSSRDTFFEGQ